MKYLFNTKRLGFRGWSLEDRIPFAKINGDNQVMRHFPKTLSSSESDDLYNKISSHFHEHGYGLYAVDLLQTGRFIGFIGFQHTTFQADFTPCVEIGWRLTPHFWNNGLATEGAKKCLEFGFLEFGFTDVFSFTAKRNKPSEKVMQKIGMNFLGEFDHPLVEAHSPLHKHVLYHISSNAI